MNETDCVVCVLANGREVRICTLPGGETGYEVQPSGDNYWVQTPSLARAVRLGNGCPTAADRRWLRSLRSR